MATILFLKNKNITDMNRFSIILSSLVTLLLYSSCDKMNDIQKEYEDRGEKVYLGKVDSIKAFSGVNQVKLTWYMTADPKIQKTIIYWNMRNDSIVRPFSRTTPGLQKDSIVIQNLPEDTHVFEFRNVNDAGETSLISTASGIVWGEEYKNGLKGRVPVMLDYHHEESLFTVQLSTALVSSGIVYSELFYTDKAGVQKVVRVERDSLMALLLDFPDGGSFVLHTTFNMLTGFEPVTSKNLTYTAPKSTVGSSQDVLTLTSVTGSNFFSIGEVLYQRNTAGDLIEFRWDGNGKLVQTNKLTALAPVATYKVFFYQDPGTYIGVKPDNKVNMLKIENDKLVIVKADLGSGFNFTYFIPFRNTFYGILNGEAKRYLPLPGGTWGTPNGTSVSKDFSSYTVISSFNNQALLGVDANGFMWAYPVNSDGSPTSKMRLGSGWNKYKQIIPFGTKLLCIDASGHFWLQDFSVYDKYWILQN